MPTDNVSKGSRKYKVVSGRKYSAEDSANQLRTQSMAMLMRGDRAASQRLRSRAAQVLEMDRQMKTRKRLAYVIGGRG